MIYYIYKVRRKQTSIRFSRSALPHRYLRYISWISWKGISPLQAGFLPVLHPVSHPVRPPTTKSRIQLRSCYCCRHPEEKENIYWSFPEKKKNVCLPFFPHSSHTTFLSCCYVCDPSRVPPAVHPRPVYRLLPTSSSAAFPQTKKCGPAALRREPAHHVCQTCSKKRRLLAQEKHTQARPAFTLLLRPQSTARIHYYPFSFLLFYKEKKKENRSKFSRFEYIARTHFVRPHDVRDWPVAPRPLKFMQQLRPVSYEIASKTSPRWRPRWNEYQSVAGI